MNGFNNRELEINELDAATGGSISDAMQYAKNIGTAVGVIAGINSVLTSAVDSIPPASCHPKS